MSEEGGLEGVHDGLAGGEELEEAVGVEAGGEGVPGEVFLGNPGAFAVGVDVVLGDAEDEVGGGDGGGAEEVAQHGGFAGEGGAAEGEGGAGASGELGEEGGVDAVGEDGVAEEPDIGAAGVEFPFEAGDPLGEGGEAFVPAEVGGAEAEGGFGGGDEGEGEPEGASGPKRRAEGAKTENR